MKINVYSDGDNGEESVEVLYEREVMEMVCYGGNPTERYSDLNIVLDSEGIHISIEDCDGNNTVSSMTLEMIDLIDMCRSNVSSDINIKIGMVKEILNKLKESLTSKRKCDKKKEEQEKIESEIIDDEWGDDTLNRTFNP